MKLCSLCLVWHAVSWPVFPLSSLFAVAQDASVGVWSPSLQFQQGFVACEEDVCPASGLHTASGGSSRRNKVMVTDCVLMENCSKLVLALTKRELQFHDIPSGSSSGQTMKIKVFGASVTAAWGCHGLGFLANPTFLLPVTLPCTASYLCATNTHNTHVFTFLDLPCVPLCLDYYGNVSR